MRTYGMFYRAGNLGAWGFIPPWWFLQNTLPMLPWPQVKNTSIVVLCSKVVCLCQETPSAVSVAYGMIGTISIHLFMLICSMFLLECPYLAQPSESNSFVTNPIKFPLSRTTFSFCLLLKSPLCTQLTPKNVTLVYS